MRTIKIKSIRKLNTSFDKFDLEIQDNHNFFANNILVHNCRAVAIIDANNGVKFFSRNGKQFTSFDNLIPFVQAMNLQGHMLDGEMCYIEEDGTENFTKIQSMGAKKDFTATNIGYKLFDCLTADEFYASESKTILSTRLARLDVGLANMNKNKIANPGNVTIQKLEQIKITSKQVFDDYLTLARVKGWEGLILRKDAGYKGKRSNDLLKVKDFKDAEYLVERVGYGPIRFVVNGKEVEEEMLSQVYIKHKGTEVGVGSGFTMEQRRRFKKNPKLVEGKMITVKYFQESQDKLGNYSLRFPTVIKIY